MARTNMNSDNIGKSSNRMMELIKSIREPAGDDFDPIAAQLNPDKFIAEFHNGLKKLHFSLIEEIMTFENVKERFLKDKAKWPKDRNIRLALSTINELLLTWRRANDCIVWIILNLDRNTIRRLCLRHTRGNLKDMNPDHALEVLYKINSDPFNLAIWNDATTCVDVGDILAIAKKEEKISLIELKAGMINKTISEIINSGSERAMHLFIETYGHKGIEQFRRTVKQEKSNLQALHLLEKDEGVDPLHHTYLRIREVKTPDYNYDKELNRLLNKARKKGSAIVSVDGCLWVLAFDISRFSYGDIFKKFSKEVIFQEGIQLENWLSEFSPRQDSTNLFPVYNLKSGLMVPESLPIFLRGISAGNVRDILLNRLGVLLFLNWNKIKDNCTEKETTFEWSSKKVGRTERQSNIYLRPLILESRVPMLKKNDFEMRIGPGFIARIIFDGVRPSAVIEQQIELLNLVREEIKQKPWK